MKTAKPRPLWTINPAKDPTRCGTQSSNPDYKLDDYELVLIHSVSIRRNILTDNNDCSTAVPGWESDTQNTIIVYRRFRSRSQWFIDPITIPTLFIE